MVSMRRFLVIATSFFVFAVFVDVSAEEYLSDHIFEPRHATGRGLLQAKKHCPENFELKNYTIITSQCKGPLYPASRCCDALKKFACPYRAVLNDAGNDCPEIMFNYINARGHYPQGLFANECKDDKIGLTCNVTSENNQVNPNTAHIVYGSSLFLVLMASIVLSLVL